jgi:hypothetical protein
MRVLRHRIKALEIRDQSRRLDSHFINVLIYPRHMAEDALEGWLSEQLRCTCRPDCPGKCVGTILPKKAPSAEAWAVRAQAYYAKRRGSHA